MSVNTGQARRRPDLWSYVSFGTPADSRGTLPYNDNDPFEKPARRYSDHQGGFDASSLGRPILSPITKTKIIRIGGIIAAILFVVYLLKPGSSTSSAASSYAAAGGQKASEPMAASTRCKTSYSPDKPLMQYALMVDAGSTGSRIHVYRFNNCAASPELEDETFEQTAKKDGGSGLSSYDADAEGAARSLDVLMKVAMSKVPASYRSCTPISVKATAGLRKLGTEKSDKILKAVRARLESVYPFPILSDEKGGVEVMDGKYEALYAWITANYLLGKIGSANKTPTAAVLDLGGGSTQIVFQPTFPNDPAGGMPAKLADGDHKYELDFGGRQFDLYQHSYLGYGLMAARENLYQLVVLEAHENNPTDRTWLTTPIINPCIQPGQSKEVDVTLPAGHSLGKSVKVKMQGPTTGSATQCQALAEKTLKKDAECKLTPCAFNGVHQPSLVQTFASEDIYLLSYFYDRIKPLGMPAAFTLSDLKDLISKVCEGASGWDALKSVSGAIKELQGRPETCLDLNFMLALLHTGYGMPMDREVKIAKKIEDRELGWCLGASLPLLSQESGWQCRITETT